MTRRPRPPSRRTARHLCTAPPPPELVHNDHPRPGDTRPGDTRPGDTHAAPARAGAQVVAVDRIDTATLTPDQRAAAVTALAALIHTWHRDTPTRHRTGPPHRDATQPGAQSDTEAA
jgi:hypothetical protein